MAASDSSTPFKILLAGAGAHGMATYARRLLPRLAAEGRLSCAGVVEPDPARRAEALAAMALEASAGFAEVEEALDALRPDILVVASPYRFHEEACLTAAARGVHLFIEKPVAHDLPACCRIERSVREAGLKAAVNMSAAFEPEKLAFGRALAEGRVGKVDYLFLRMAWDHTAAAKHRKDDPHPYLTEGGIHGLEMLLRYAGARPMRVYNMAWPSAHSVFSGKASNLVSFECENGVRCALEGSWTVQAGISTWRDEYIRADGSRGALQLDCRRLEHLSGRRDPPEGLRREPIPYDDFRDETGGTAILLRAFLDWLDGSATEHPTELSANLQTMALLFAARESAERGEAVDVQAFLRRCGG